MVGARIGGEEDEGRVQPVFDCCDHRGAIHNVHHLCADYARALVEQSSDGVAQLAPVATKPLRAVTVPVSPTWPGLVSLNWAREAGQVVELVLDRADAVGQMPGRLLPDFQVALQLHRDYNLDRGCSSGRGQSPKSERPASRTASPCSS